jgi:peptidoglycan hydrolase CwlO-like protein
MQMSAKSKAEVEDLEARLIASQEAGKLLQERLDDLQRLQEATTAQLEEEQVKTTKTAHELEAANATIDDLQTKVHQVAEEKVCSNRVRVVVSG